MAVSQALLVGRVCTRLVDTSQPLADCAAFNTNQTGETGGKGTSRDVPASNFARASLRQTASLAYRVWTRYSSLNTHRIVASTRARIRTLAHTRSTHTHAHSHTHTHACRYIAFTLGEDLRRGLESWMAQWYTIKHVHCHHVIDTGTGADQSFASQWQIHTSVR